MACHLLAVFTQLCLLSWMHWLCWTFWMHWILFYLEVVSLFPVGVGILFICRLYSIVHCCHLLCHLIYWLLRHFESLRVSFFHLFEMLLVLLLHHGKHHFRVFFFFFFPGGFFFYVVSTVEFGSLACSGTWKLHTILVQFTKLYLDVGPCFIAYCLLLLFDQIILCKVIRLPHLVDVNADNFISTGCNVPGIKLIGDIV